MKLNRSFLTVSAWLLLSGTGFTLAVLAGMYLYLSPQLPSVESLKDVRLQTPLRIYSADGVLIGEFGEQRRTPIRYDDIPQQYIDALLAAEDDQFYSHNGVSIKGITRAVSHLIIHGRKGPGGSTITQQVARNFFLSRKKTFARKFNEILLALRIERELSKEEILELYVNVIFLGKRAYGIEAAAEVYYGKPLANLSLAQLAMIAGLPQGPSTQNPINNPERAIERRNWIIGRMLELEMIDRKTHDLAIQEPVTAKYHGSDVDGSAAFVAEMARDEAISLFGLDAYTDGYSIYTTINSDLQASAQQAIVDGLLMYDQRHGYRGPEQQLDVNDAPLLTETSTNSVVLESAESVAADGTVIEESSEQPENPVSSPRDFSNWIETLSAISAYGGLYPAAVTGIEEQQFTALMADGSQVVIGWESGISKVRRYLNENARGPAPKTAADVVAVGDVIRLKKDSEGVWNLSQVPDAQAALISLAPTNGAILSLVGGFDFAQSNFNRAIQARRQPGSNFKPFLYTAALEQGMTPATIINDAPIVFDDEQLESTWRPENDGGKFEGPTRLRKALYRSRNLVSIRILRQLGISEVINGMARFGFNEETLPRNLSLALGSQGVSPIEIATGYAVFANGGYQVKPFLINQIRDIDGNIVFEAQPFTVCRECDELVDLTENANTPSQNEGETSSTTDELALTDTEQPNKPYDFTDDPFEVDFAIKSRLGILKPEDYPPAPKALDDRVAFLIDSILQDVIRRGTGTRALELKRSDLAGKTGTTNGPTDAWFSGYNGDVVTTTWVGFDQMSNLGRREYGGSAALPIWIDFMRTALDGKPETYRKQPQGIVTVRIDPETGARARVGDPDAIFEFFRSENVPELSEKDSPINSPYESEEVITEELF